MRATLAGLRFIVGGLAAILLGPLLLNSEAGANLSSFDTDIVIAPVLIWMGGVMLKPKTPAADGAEPPDADDPSSTDRQEGAWPTHFASRTTLLLLVR
jgi:hypothetical protein